MPFTTRKRKCKMESGKSGTHVIYKKKGKKMTRVGCTSDPDGAVKARYAAEKGMIKEEDKLMESIKMMVREELNALEEEKSCKERCLLLQSKVPLQCVAICIRIRCIS